MKFVSIMSLLVLSAIGLAESRRRRRRRAKDGEEGGKCGNYPEDDEKVDIKCKDGLKCCDEGVDGEGVDGEGVDGEGVCRKYCNGAKEITFDQAQPGQGQEQAQQRRRRYRRRY